MGIKETESQRIARQLRAIMDKHRVSPQEIQKRTGISYTTVNRILKAEAKTQPQPHKLRKIAEALGEKYEQAFPVSPADEDAISIDVGGRKLALKTLDDKPVNLEQLERFLREHSTELAEQIHRLKQERRKK